MAARYFCLCDQCSYIRVISTALPNTHPILSYPISFLSDKNFFSFFFHSYQCYFSILFFYQCPLLIPSLNPLMDHYQTSWIANLQKLVPVHHFKIYHVRGVCSPLIYFYYCYYTHTWIRSHALWVIQRIPWMTEFTVNSHYCTNV